MRSFRFHLLQQATNYFDEARVVGHGGFGKVYVGELEGKKFAMKRRSLESSQGQKEFQAEIELLSGLNHRNLVSLIGFCDEENELILVYEYMEKGSLMSHLYGSGKPSLLNWKQRLDVCVGTAKGLHYLHTKAIIHRDVKSSNILLDEKLHAKVTDFGISKPGPELDQTHVITEVKGSFGYLDPEYCKTMLLTQKSDVYSFGVVLLEVLCGRPAIDRTLPLEEVNLADWGKEMLRNGQLEQIVDQEISGTVKQRSLMPFGQIVARCLEDKGADRPSMGDVLRYLEYVHSLEAKKNALTRSVAMICVKISNVADGFSGPSTPHRVSPVLDDSIISVAGNSDEPVHDISAGSSDDETDHGISPGNSDEHDHNVSSQLIKPGISKALLRSNAKIFERYEDPDHGVSSELIGPGKRKALTRSDAKIFER
uniref:Protein kinase domain-containing protein n=1 Tax=Oryza rufipogon TaxID=4529 RepID=A0A0E0P829_ORYRU